MRRPIWLPLLVALLASPASADERGRTLETLPELHRACREAEAPGRRALYAIELPPGSWRLGDYVEADGYLAVDTRRNLRAFGGAAELLPSNLEPIGFVATPRRARALRRAAEAGATLRIGFFLGFDEPERTLCLIRPAVGVTTVRMDVAFAELVGGDGRVIAREGGDRLRAWLDDAERDSVPGEGPRGAMGPASVSGGAGIAPESWQQAIAAANRGPVARAIGRCHAEGLGRGAAGSGDVIVRLTVDPATGEVRDAGVELSSIGDRREAQCVAESLRALRLPPGPGPTRISLPVRLRN